MANEQEHFDASRQFQAFYARRICGSNTPSASLGKPRQLT